MLTSLAVLIVTFGPAAPATADLATLTLGASSGRPGGTVTVTGASFVVARAGTGTAPTPVEIRWHREDGPVLAQAMPDRSGSISATFTIPHAAPGAYVVVATQQTPRPAPDAPPEQPPARLAEPGTPARASFEILAAATIHPPVAVDQVAVDQVAVDSDLDSTVWIVLTAAFGAVAMSLFGGGLIAFVHQSRTSRLSAEARWVPPGWYG